MVEHGDRIQDHLKQDHRDHRRPKRHDDGDLDQHSQDDLAGMKARPGSEVVVEVGVMDAMQPPKRRHAMEAHVLHPDRKIQHHDGEQDLNPDWPHQGVQQSSALRIHQQRHPHRGGREQQLQQHRIQHHQAEVAAPALQQRQQPNAARRNDLPGGHQGENA